MTYKIHLSKENFKFSCSHFTVFSREEAERLHGHNYYVKTCISIDEIDKKLGMAFDFNLVKPIIKKICDELDEYVLIPNLSPYLKIKQNSQQVEVVFGDKFYSFPKSDVRLLPIVNVTSEELARHFTTQLVEALKSKISFRSISVSVKETSGQSVVYSFSNNKQKA